MTVSNDQAAAFEARIHSYVSAFSGQRILLFANTDWYLWNFRRSLALAAQDAGCDVLLVSPPGDYGQRFTALGLHWLPLAMDRRSLNPLRELGVLWRLWRLLRRERPVLVHGFTIKCAVYGAIAARMARVPARVNAVAGLGYVFSSGDMKARVLRPLVRWLMRFALGGGHARLVLQNTDDTTLFKKAGVTDAVHLRLIRGSGVDCARFSPCTENRKAGPLRVLLAARLLWDKGVAEYVEAARALHAQGVGVEILLAGMPDPGNPAAVPESMLQAWADEGVLKWMGHVEDMAQLFRSVDIVVLPSYREGLPKSLIEAGACGLPLVTTDVAGCREVVTDGVDGLLVPPRDSGALASAIARLVMDAKLRERLGGAARAKVLAEFGERIVIKKTLDVYHELLHMPRPNQQG